jgi:hypothetical protein
MELFFLSKDCIWEIATINIHALVIPKNVSNKIELELGTLINAKQAIELHITLYGITL